LTVSRVPYRPAIFIDALVVLGDRPGGDVDATFPHARPPTAAWFTTAAAQKCDVGVDLFLGYQLRR